MRGKANIYYQVGTIANLLSQVHTMDKARLLQLLYEETTVPVE